MLILWHRCICFAVKHSVATKSQISTCLQSIVIILFMTKPGKTRWEVIQLKSPITFSGFLRTFIEWIWFAYCLYLSLLYKLQTKNSLLNMRTFVHFYNSPQTFCCSHEFTGQRQDFKWNWCFLAVLPPAPSGFFMGTILIYTIHYLNMLQLMKVISSHPSCSKLLKIGLFTVCSSCPLFSEIYFNWANKSDDMLRSY